MSETLERTEARAVGVVADHTSRRTYSSIYLHSSLLFFPSVRFQMQDGRTVEFQTKIGSTAPPRVGIR